jgi:ATP-dependent helicase HrpB
MNSRQDYRTVQHIEQLRRLARPRKQIKHDDDALLMSILAGYPDRVARRRAGNQLLLSTGISAEIAGAPPPRMSSCRG